jgi:hypothetical protein
MYKVIPNEEDNLPKLAQPALRALYGAGITRLEQLADLSEEDLKSLHGIGPNAVEALRKALAEKGKAFAQPRESAHG